MFVVNCGILYVHGTPVLPKSSVCAPVPMTEKGSVDENVWPLVSSVPVTLTMPENVLLPLLSGIVAPLVPVAVEHPVAPFERSAQAA
jgi:hypothetical protein